MHGQCSVGSSQGAWWLACGRAIGLWTVTEKHGRGRPQEAQEEETARGSACGFVGGEVVGARASVCNTQYTYTNMLFVRKMHLKPFFLDDGSERD